MEEDRSRRYRAGPSRPGRGTWRMLVVSPTTVITCLFSTGCRARTPRQHRRPSHKQCLSRAINRRYAWHSTPPMYARDTPFPRGDRRHTVNRRRARDLRGEEAEDKERARDSEGQRLVAA
eukprot:2848735-Rhodomonas_salina.1